MRIHLQLADSKPFRLQQSSWEPNIKQSTKPLRIAEAGN